MDDRGIDSNILNKQIQSLEFYIAEMKTELSNITTLINSVGSYYVGDGAHKIVSRYKDTQSRYDSMYVKLNNYVTTLEDTITNYNIASERIAGNINT